MRYICLTDHNKVEYSLLMDKGKREKLPLAIRNYLASLGRKGAKARAEKFSRKRRSAIAKKAAKARWSKSKKKEKP